MTAFIMAAAMHAYTMLFMHDSMGHQAFSKGQPIVFTALCNYFDGSYFSAAVVRRAPQTVPAMLIHVWNSPAA